MVVSAARGTHEIANNGQVHVFLMNQARGSARVVMGWDHWGARAAAAGARRRAAPSAVEWGVGDRSSSRSPRRDGAIAKLTAHGVTSCRCPLQWLQDGGEKRELRLFLNDGGNVPLRRNAYWGTGVLPLPDMDDDGVPELAVSAGVDELVDILFLDVASAASPRSSPQRLDHRRPARSPRPSVGERLPIRRVGTAHGGPGTARSSSSPQRPSGMLGPRSRPRRGRRCNQRPLPQHTGEHGRSRRHGSDTRRLRAAGAVREPWAAFPPHT